MVPPQNTQSGNILIYILGAIFLMGLLVVVARGSFSPGAGIDEETLLIRVSEVQEYGNELEQAVRLVLANGYSEADIRFAHPDADAAYGVITDDPGRQVFSREGGSATYRDVPSGIQATATDWLFNAKNIVRHVGVPTCGSSGSACTELIAFLPNVTIDFCLAINKKNEISTSSGDPPQDDTNADITSMFTGDYIRSTSIQDLTDYLSGHLEGCFEGGNNPAAGTYHYYRVLLAR